MKIPLCAALGLHTAVLVAAARWAPAPQIAWQPLELGTAREIPVDAVPPPPPPPPKTEAPRTPGPARTSRAGGSAPVRAGPLVRREDLAPPTALASWILAARVRSDQDSPNPSPVPEATGRGNGSVPGDGEGDGEQAAKARRRRRGGMGESWDSVAGPHAEDPPEVRTVEADEITLSRRTIEGVVARSAGRLRFCYEDGNRREPGLAGQIPVRFSVDAGGSVLVATDGGSTVADPAVVRCVLSAFAAMTFPARGRSEVVKATYLVAFPPG